MPHKKRTASGVFGGLLGLVGLSAVAGLLITATVTPAIALTGAATTSAISLFENLPSVLKIDQLMLPSTIYAKSSDGKKWVTLTRFYDQNRSPVKFDQIKPVVYDAVLSSEDKNYYQHGGVDLVGTVSALVSNLRGNDTRGGSSISQQYVKNVLVQKCEWEAATSEEALACWTEATQSTGTVGYQRKLQEMRYAIALEQDYSKNDILLGYLNIANFGGQTYGIDAAARYYFGVPAAKLKLTQAATLAGMVQNPNTYRIDMPDGSTTDADGNALNGAEDGYSLAKERRNYVLDRMLADGKITQEQHDKATAADVKPHITQPTTGCGAAKNAQYFCQYVKNIIKNDKAFGENDEDRLATLQRGGLKIYTTLDYNLQKTAVRAMKDSAPTSLDGMTNIKTGKFGAAAVSIEVSTGRILSIAQNTKFSEASSRKDDPNYSSLVYAGDSKYGNSIGFPVGSTFKLFTLVDWLEQGHSVNEYLNGRVRVIDRMTNSCGGDWVNVDKTKVNNFNSVGGYYGTPMQFTRDSLNSGYFAMAEELDLCDIEKVATKMGVTRGDGTPVEVDRQFDIIGSNNVTPIAMAAAYGTIGNNGVYCQPKAIDKVLDADGNEMKLPKTSCTRVLDEDVAATAAYALKGVMAYGGTGATSNPGDGTEVIGKTGTHESHQTWMVESSTAVATAVWVGNSEGEGNIFDRWANGWQVSQLRHKIAPVIQRAADSIYPGSSFPAPSAELTKRVLRDLPSVIGLSVDEARSRLQSLGFGVTVGDPVDAVEAEGTVVEQSPGAGKVAGGSNVTIRPSNGKGVAVPGVAGLSVQDASNTLRAAGLDNLVPGRCTVDPSVDGPGTATGTSPGEGTVVGRNTKIAVNYAHKDCGKGGGDDND
ncbi:transglycosylase domain-containing protein [Microbacterium terricola]|uniref:Carboxypeptidase n=1 Tax=Microbacterium terricola TaxID=344163 RepID=A0ABM8E0U3_9MICO|nr:transglycosylase domain-containing protein [Microbacterium terricola]UYK40880.1 transglycosylase domain-containing protein [Microbacterium terricola]BDV31370.1 carboxypeptidase [Microbacterium terricola]